MYWKAEPRFTATQTCILLNLAVGMFWFMSQAARVAAWSQVSEQRQLRWRTQHRCNEASEQWSGGPFNFGAAAGAVSRRNGERHLPLGLHATEISHGQGANCIGTGEGARGPLYRSPYPSPRSQARAPGSSHGCCISMFSLSPVALLVSIESPCACLPTQRNATCLYARLCAAVSEAASSFRWGRHHLREPPHES